MGTDSTPDGELWASAGSGSTAAFAALFDRHAAAVYNQCFRLTGSWAEAEDLTSTVFLQAWRRRGEVRITDGGVLPWLLAVAGNTARTERRSLARRLRLAARVGPQPDAADHADDVAARVDDERRMTEVLAAARRLPRAEREALQLCVWGEVPYADAAEVLGITAGSVRARVSRARSRLARLLSEPGPDPRAEPDHEPGPDPGAEPGHEPSPEPDYEPHPDPDAGLRRISEESR